MVRLVSVVFAVQVCLHQAGMNPWDEIPEPQDRPELQQKSQELPPDPAGLDIRAYRMKAEEGDLESMFVTGLLLATGRGGADKDEKGGRDWLEKAAKKGFQPAQRKLGEMLIAGQGHPTNTPNYRRALKWLKAAAKHEKPDADADWLIASIYQSPHTFFEEDQKKATEWYMKAQEHGFGPVAGLEVGKRLIMGTGCSQDTQAAKRVLLESSKMTNMTEQQDQRDNNKGALENIQLTLAQIFYNESDSQEAFKWFKKSADGGNVESMFFAGRMLEEGNGVTEDKAKGAKYLGTAAEKGHRKATAMYGTYLLDGNSGVTIDTEKGLEMLIGVTAGDEKTEHDDLAGQVSFELGLRYAEGKGLEKDLEEAGRWLRKAADLGVTDALTALKNAGLGELLTKDEEDSLVPSNEDYDDEEDEDEDEDEDGGAEGGEETAKAAHDEA